jgi:hypothetical protein
VTALRVALGLLAAEAASVGVPAAFAPRTFYDDFPFVTSWVAALPPYNEHLVTDVGGLYLAFALLFAWAAAKPSRELIVPAATAFALFSALHLAFHTTHLDHFGTTDAVAQTISLAAVLVASIGAAILARRRPPSRAAS